MYVCNMYVERYQISQGTNPNAFAFTTNLLLVYLFQEAHKSANTTVIRQLLYHYTQGCINSANTTPFITKEDDHRHQETTQTSAIFLPKLHETQGLFTRYPISLLNRPLPTNLQHSFLLDSSHQPSLQYNPIDSPNMLCSATI